MNKAERDSLKGLVEIYMVASAFKAGIPIVEIKTDNEANFAARSYVQFAQPARDKRENFGFQKEQLSSKWLNVANIQYCRKAPEKDGEYSFFGAFGNHSTHMQYIFEPQQKGLRTKLEQAISELSPASKPVEENSNPTTEVIPT